MKIYTLYFLSYVLISSSLYGATYNLAPIISYLLSDTTATVQEPNEVYQLVGEVTAKEPSIIEFNFYALDENNEQILDLDKAYKLNPSIFKVYEDDNEISTSESFLKVLGENKDVNDYEKMLILIDNSSSISFANLDQVKTSIKNFINAEAVDGILPNNTFISIKTFSGALQTVIDYTNDRNQLISAINNISRGEPTTNLYGVYKTVLDSFANVTGSVTENSVHHTLILMTDGKDQASISTLSTALSSKKDNSVFVIHVDGSESDISISQQLASEQNSLFNLTNYTQIQIALSDALEYASKRTYYNYRLQYASPKRAGEHTVKIQSGKSTITALFNADSFTSVSPILDINVDSVTSIELGSNKTIKLEMQWTSQDDIAAENFQWESSDESILKIVSKASDVQSVDISLVGIGSATLTVTAPLHGLSKAISIDSELSELSSIDTFGTVYDIFVDAKKVYLADGSAGLSIIDISDIKVPKLLGVYDTTGVSRGVFVQNGIAYVADGTSGLQLINVSNASSPQHITTFDTSGTAYDVEVVDGIAYIADGTSGLQILDVHDTNNIQNIGNYYLTGIDARSLEISNTKLKLAAGNLGRVDIDISVPSSPTYVDSIDTSGFTYSINGNLVADGLSGIQYIHPEDIYGLPFIDNEPLNILGTFNTSGIAYDTKFFGNKYFVADGSTGLGLYSIDLSWTKECTKNCFSAPIIIRTGLTTYKYTYSLSGQYLENFNTSGILYSLEADENNLFLGDGEAGLHIYGLQAIIY